MLKSLPESLDETYERMLCNIDSYWIEDTQRMLTMLCFASRPLTVRELIDSVAVETGESAGLNRKRRLQDFDGIREICGGLVDIVFDSVEDGNISEDEDASEDGVISEDGHTSEHEEASVEISHKYSRTSDRTSARIVPTVRIAHFSVQEYLESERIRSQKAASFGLSSITAHAEIAELCLIYLLEPGLSRTKIDQAILKEYPLADFAAMYWYYHYKKTKNRTSGPDTCILRLFQSQTSFVTWVRLHDVDHASEPDFVYIHYKHHSRREEDIPAPIYYASLLGLDKVLRELLHFEKEEGTTMSAASLTDTLNISKQTFSATGQYGGAIQAAAHHCDEHIIQILLDSGFDINDQGDYNASYSALYVASLGGHEKVVRMLLDRGADVNAESPNSGSALQAASRWGYKEVVGVLLDRGADINAQSGRFGSPLQEASREGHKEVVELLLDRGADVNAEGALRAASGSGHKEIVQILLNRGADVNSHGRSSSALQRASDLGHKEIVQILLDRGAWVNSQSGLSGSALQAAARQGHKEIVAILLNRGADVNLQGRQHSTALCGASRNGKGEIVQMLLDSGARVSIGNDRALMHAVRRGESDMMQMLLNGMNAEDFDNEYQMVSSSSKGLDIKISELLETHDFLFRHKPAVTKEA